MKRLAEKTTGFMAEFRKFIARGNVLDMAVGVIIGGAFGKISTSLVNDVLMPAISMLTGGIDFTDWKLVLKEAVVENGEEIAAAVSINYGAFLSTVLDFLIIAFAPPEPSAEEKLLTEIRDLLRQQSAGKEEAHG